MSQHLDLPALSVDDLTRATGAGEDDYPACTTDNPYGQPPQQELTQGPAGPIDTRNPQQKFNDNMDKVNTPWKLLNNFYTGPAGGSARPRK